MAPEGLAFTGNMAWPGPAPGMEGGGGGGPPKRWGSNPMWPWKLDGGWSDVGPGAKGCWCCCRPGGAWACGACAPAAGCGVELWCRFLLLTILILIGLFREGDGAVCECGTGSTGLLFTGA